MRYLPLAAPPLRAGPLALIYVNDLEDDAKTHPHPHARGYIHLAQNTGQQDCLLLQFHALGIKNKHICTLIAKSL